MKVEVTHTKIIYTRREKYNPWLRHKARKRQRIRIQRQVDARLKEQAEYKGSSLVMNLGCCGRPDKESCVRPPCPVNIECWTVDEVRDLHDAEVVRCREARDRSRQRDEDEAMRVHRGF